jgi:cytochrome P450
MILPLSKPIKTTIGEEITELLVPQNTTIHISIIGANRNPNIWGTDSHEWKPERWLSPLPENVKEAHIPGVYSHL